jgi:pyruvate dehydrogenase E2 component (dihydrolipoamide acetyltransferase)
MASEIKLPNLGENVAGGDVIEVKVTVGDEVHAGQTLIEVEAEKITAEVPTSIAGKVTQILVKKGDKVAPGQVIALIDGTNGQAGASVPAGKMEETPKETAPIGEKAAPNAKEALVPKLQLGNDGFGEKADAAAKEAGPKGEQAKAAGKETAPKSEQAEAAKETKPKTQEPARSQAPAWEREAPAPAENRVIHAGPATRRFARDFEVDLGQVPGSGPAGRVTQDDVKNYLRALAGGGGGSSPSFPSWSLGTRVPPLPNFEQWGPVAAKPLDSIRKTVAEHLSLCWNLIPHVTHHDTADVTDIEAFRKQQETKGTLKITVTAFILKACAILLKQTPQFNASLDAAKEELIYKNYYHLGVAVDTERGLVVPKLRDVDKKSVYDIAKEMAEIAERARQRKLAREDLQGGTFTISNLGGIGGTGFSPIVNWPEVAILGLSRARMQPVWKDDLWVPRLHLPMSLSYDHRVIDGADAARFCRNLAELLENPLVMLLHA